MSEQHKFNLDSGGIPTRDEVNALLGESYTKKTYEGYHRPLFNYLYQMNEHSQISTEDLIEKTINQGEKADVQEGSKADYVRDVLKIEPYLGKKVGDHFPTGVELVKRGKKRINLSEESGIPADKIVDVQQACEQIGNDVKNSILEFYANEMKIEAAKDVGINIDENDGISSDELDTLLTNIAEKTVEYADKVRSIQNSRLNNSGRANELLAVEALKAKGLSEGNKSGGHDFVHCGDRKDEDLIIFAENYKDLNIEVKSISARERTERALLNASNPTILFSFLQNAKEIKNGIVDSNDDSNTELRRWPDESIAAYVPQKTIDMIQKNYSDDILSFTNENCNKYLRSCSKFSKDMSQYRETGELRNLGRPRN